MSSSERAGLRVFYYDGDVFDTAGFAVLERDSDGDEGGIEEQLR
ncbi:hypothetical protein [Streptomyces sp. NPDC023588]